MRISDWSSDVCSSDLIRQPQIARQPQRRDQREPLSILAAADPRIAHDDGRAAGNDGGFHLPRIGPAPAVEIDLDAARSEEHTSELQSLMRISYAVFCLKKKKHHHTTNTINTHIKHLQKTQK